MSLKTIIKNHKSKSKIDGNSIAGMIAKMLLYSNESNGNIVI